MLVIIGKPCMAYLQRDLSRLYWAIIVPLFWIQQMFEFYGQNMVVGLYNSETNKKMQGMIEKNTKN